MNQSNPFHESSQDDPEDSSKNPFDIEEEDNLAEDDYDKSGKNPFAEWKNNNNFAIKSPIHRTILWNNGMYVL